MHIELLHRPSQSIAQCRLDPGESILAESGAMMGMSPNVVMTTQSGGFLGGLKRMFGGESFFRNTFTAHGGPGEVLLTTPLSGDMAVLEVGQSQWLIQSSAFVACTPGADVATRSGGLSGFFSGAGLFVLESHGSGQIVMGGFGALEAVQVEGSLVVDTGHVAAWQSTLTYEVGKSGSGRVASFLSGEGLVCHFHGRGTVWLQTRNPQEFGQAIGRLLPPRQE